jgi:Kef-type K+ transport system membrane component KefB
MNIHPIFAVGILLVGWFGFALRRSSLGGIVAGLVAFEGLLAVAALAVFIGQDREISAGPVLLWVFFFGVVVFLISAMALGLRQYYAYRSVRWAENEEIKH